MCPCYWFFKLFGCSSDWMNCNISLSLSPSRWGHTCRYGCRRIRSRSPEQSLPTAQEVPFAQENRVPSEEQHGGVWPLRIPALDPTHPSWDRLPESVFRLHVCPHVSCFGVCPVLSSRVRMHVKTNADLTFYLFIFSPFVGRFHLDHRELRTPCETRQSIGKIARPARWASRLETSGVGLSGVGGSL